MGAHGASRRPQEQTRHPKSSQASCTPVTDGNVVVAHFGSEGLYAFDTNGNLQWKVDLGILNAGWFFDPDYEWGVASSPIIYKGMVIVQVDIQKESYVAAFRLKDGKQVWKTIRDELPSWPTPTIFENGTRTDLVTHATKAIRGYDPMTGKQLWQLTGNSEVTAPTPILRTVSFTLRMDIAAFNRSTRSNRAPLATSRSRKARRRMKRSHGAKSEADRIHRLR